MGGGRGERIRVQARSTSESMASKAIEVERRRVPEYIYIY